MGEHRVGTMLKPLSIVVSVALLAATLLAAALLAAAYGGHAQAQSRPADRSLMFDPNGLHGTKAAPPARQPQATRRAQPAPAAPRARQTAPAPNRRAVAPARDAHPRVTEREVTGAAPPALGRIPFETGTLGLTTDRQYYNSAFADGRVTPGFENIQTKSPSYFGLSLSVPTDKQRLFPLPLFTPQN